MLSSFLYCSYRTSALHNTRLQITNQQQFTPSCMLRIQTNANKLHSDWNLQTKTQQIVQIMTAINRDFDCDHCRSDQSEKCCTIVLLSFLSWSHFLNLFIWRFKKVSPPHYSWTLLSRTSKIKLIYEKTVYFGVSTVDSSAQSILNLIPSKFHHGLSTCPEHLQFRYPQFMFI